VANRSPISLPASTPVVFHQEQGLCIHLVCSHSAPGGSRWVWTYTLQ